MPIYPPARLSQIEEHVRRHAGILSNAEATILVTVPEARGVARLLEARVAGLRRVVTVAELQEGGRVPLPVPIRPDDIAFIQYTSGSTGDPKGVVLTHANLMANIRAIGEVIDVRPDDVLVSWLPLYHDMGLISMWLAGLYFAMPLVVMSPLAFLARPERWLRAIQRYRGTVSAAPNFAYELCVKRIDDAEIDGLDLSSWRIAANGAEPVLPETLRRFTERFARYGFHPAAMTPVYGLAECTVGLLCPPLDRGPRIDRVRRQPFSQLGRAEPAAADDVGALRFVSCGRPLPGHEVRIVDALGREVGERVEGRLEFRGPSATGGYYRNPEQTRRLFDGDWLDTGDRAYLADGEVHLTGRVKDIIIRGGRNIYPHEVEDAVGAVPGVRRGCIAAFGSPDPSTGTERLVVLAETRETGAAEQDGLRARIVEVTVAALGEPPDEVVLAPPHTVLKTSSGKIRRAACRELYEAGRVGARGHAAWWQVIRLISGSLLPQARQVARAVCHVLYGLYAWLIFALIAPPTWLLTVLARRPAVAWRVNRLGGAAHLSARRHRAHVARPGTFAAHALRVGGEPREFSGRHRHVRRSADPLRLRGQARVPGPPDRAPLSARTRRTVRRAFRRPAKRRGRAVAGGNGEGGRFGRGLSRGHLQATVGAGALPPGRLRRGGGGAGSRAAGGDSRYPVDVTRGPVAAATRCHHRHHRQSGVAPFLCAGRIHRCRGSARRGACAHPGVLRRA